VQQDRTLHLEHARQELQQLGEVVPVDRTDVAEAELLEECPRDDEVFDAFLDLAGKVLNLL
jgi:hypothetical protein